MANSHKLECDNDLIICFSDVLGGIDIGQNARVNDLDLLRKGLKGSFKSTRDSRLAGYHRSDGTFQQCNTPSHVECHASVPQSSDLEVRNQLTHDNGEHKLKINCIQFEFQAK